jgi:hypothetical protein
VFKKYNIMAVSKLIVSTSLSETFRCSLRNLNVREVGHISLFRWRECEDPVHLKREIGTCFELVFELKGTA